MLDEAKYNARALQRTVESYSRITRTMQSYLSANTDYGHVLEPQKYFDFASKVKVIDLSTYLFLQSKCLSEDSDIGIHSLSYSVIIPAVKLQNFTILLREVSNIFVTSHDDIEWRCTVHQFYCVLSRR
jgi:hypothetical protein